MTSHAPKLEKAYNELQEAIKSGDKEAINAAKTTYERTAKNITVNNKRFQGIVDETTSKISHTNEIAVNYVNSQMANVYTVNYNAFGKQKIKGYSFSLVNENAVKQLATKDKTLLPTKKLNVLKDKRWNQKNINSQMLQGILQGESIPKMANRLMTVTDMNRVSAIRNARTMTTAAENKGKQDSYKKASDDGVIMKRIWVSTSDERTRAWHADLDGVEVDVDEPWENEYGEIMQPGDPSADPANVYNCRCTMRVDVKGFKWDLEDSDQKAEEVIMPITAEMKKSLDFDDINYDTLVKAKEEANFEGSNYDFFVKYKSGEIDSELIDKEVFSSKLDVNLPTIEQVKTEIETSIDVGNIKTLQNVDDQIQQSYDERIKYASGKGQNLDYYNQMDSVLNDLVENNEFRMRIPTDDPSVVESIINDGRLKSQFETGTSKGALDGELRSNASKQFYGFEGTISDRDYEKYGYLGSSDVAKDAFKAVDSYGDGIVTFKKEALMDRTTITVGDSLAHYRLDEIGGKGNTYGYTTPCKVTDIKSIVCSSDVFSSESTRIDNLEGIKQVASKNNSNMGSFSKFFGGSKNGYLELQYHGDLTLNDIESLTLDKNTIDYIVSKDDLVEKLKQSEVTLQYVEKGKVVIYDF